jgi:hypothetical protein
VVARAEPLNDNVEQNSAGLHETMRTIGADGGAVKVMTRPT